MRFSKRTPAGLEISRQAELLQHKRDQGADLIDLTESNPTRAGFRYPQQQILQAFESDRLLTYAPTAQGLAEARRAVADYYAQRGSRVDADDIFLTASTSEAYSLIFKLMLDPGDQLLAPRPGYPLVDWLARAEGLEVGDCPFFFDEQWQPELAGLEENIGARTRLLALVHPNNPTGTFLKASEWAGMAEVCRRHGLAVVCDEVFGDYGLESGDGGLEERRERFDPLRVEDVPMFVLNGLSKAAGLPQMKLGWIVLRGPSEFRGQAAQRLEFLADHYLSVGTPVQWAAARLLEAGKGVRRQIRERTRGNLAHLQAALADSAARPRTPEGGWYATVELPRLMSDEEWALLLLDQDQVVVHPGQLFDFPDGCRIVLSLLPSSEAFREGVARLARRLGDLTQSRKGAKNAR